MMTSNPAIQALAARALEWKRTSWIDQGSLAEWCRADEDGVRRELVMTSAAIALVAVVLIGWGATARLASAVIASGTVVVDSAAKKVQHQTGGIVGQIDVKDGDHVEAGAVLLRLDDTIAFTNLQIITRQLDQFAQRERRLKAERDGLDELEVAPVLKARASEPSVAEIIAEETTLFRNRQAARNGLRSQLNERVSQLTHEIDGLASQLSAKAKELSLISDELTGVRDLYRKNLVQLARLNALERDAARLEGEKGQLLAATAQANGKIAETRLQILQIDQDLRTEVTKELREQQAKEAELIERRVAAQDQLRRIDIRAPQRGTVHQMSIHTVGGVVSPGETLMLIVPDDDRLVVEAKIAPQDIDHVRIGQPAIARLNAFSQSVTPEVTGKVIYVAADLTTEPQQGRSYYLAKVAFDETSAGSLKGLKLLPGMPAELHLQNGDRTALSYMFKPLADQIARAFKEH